MCVRESVCRGVLLIEYNQMKSCRGAQMGWGWIKVEADEIWSNQLKWPNPAGQNIQPLRSDLIWSAGNSLTPR